MRRPPEDELARQAIANVAAKCPEALTVIARRLDELARCGPASGRIAPPTCSGSTPAPNAWYSLIGDRGWTFDQAEDWLRDAARRDLLS